METLRFHCSSCKQPLRVPADKAGRKVRCGRCGAILLAPSTVEEKPTPQEAAPTESPAPAEQKETATYGFAPEDPAPQQAESRRRKPAPEPETQSDEVRVRRRKRPQLSDDEATDDEPRTRRRTRDAEDTEEDGKHKPRKQPARKKGKWHLVSIGLVFLMVVAGISALEKLGTLIVLMLPIMTLGRLLGSMPGWAVPAALCLPGLVEGGLSIIGCALCYCTPPLYSVRQWATAALVVAVIGVVLASRLGFFFQSLNSKPDVPNPTFESTEKIKAEDVQKKLKEMEAAQKKLEALQAASMKSMQEMLNLFFQFQLAGYASMIVVPFFLRSVALNAESAAADTCMSLLKLSGAGVALGVIFQVVLQVGFRSESLAVARLIISLMAITTLIGLGYAIWQFLILLGIRMDASDLVGRRAG
jgi:hypothetical protein